MDDGDKYCIWLPRLLGRREVNPFIGVMQEMMLIKPLGLLGMGEKTRDGESGGA